MGITSILSAALKHIPMDQVTTIAMQYGPDIIKKFKEKIQSAETNTAVNVGELSESIQVLEAALIHQKEMIELQNNNILLLEVKMKTFQARLVLCMMITSGSAFLSLALLVILLRH